MNPIVWGVVGVLAGLVASVMMGTRGLVGRIENALVGVFGAFIGGEFIASMVMGPPVAGAFRGSSLALAVATAVGMLVLLAWMRTAVGPMRPHKVRRKRN